MDIDRRKFIGASAIGAVALIATACGKKTASSGSVNTSLNAALINDDLIENETSRVAFVLRKGNEVVSPTKVQVAVNQDPSHWSGDVDTTLHQDTQGGAAYYRFEHAFGQTGTYFAHIKSPYGSTTAAINVVHASAITMPKPGDKMIPFDSPTTKDARGVDPICTRIPPCPMHEATITEALATKKPVLVAFATPALCQTATCGPVVDVVMAVKDKYPNVQYLHEEIYTNKTGRVPAPTPSAYKLMSEPITYLANSDGTIATRIDGLVGEAELSAALAKLN